MMRAVTMTDWSLAISELPDIVPGPSQVAAQVEACGICGSDLHLLVHGARQLALSEELAAEQPPDPMRPVPFVADRACVMGHEFACTVIELGPDCERLRIGDLVVSVPVVFDSDGIHGIGFSNVYNGGFATHMVLNDLMALKVPNGLDAQRAALTEPMAVGIHAVARSAIVVGESAVVLGCGPVGLAVIAALKLSGIGPIVASDFSPRRRLLATAMGADVTVDPAIDDPMAAWRGCANGTTPVIFEAVGVPGMLDRAMRMGPKLSRICVVGACMEDDTIRPLIGIGREHTISFALGYTLEEFASSLHAIAQGDIVVDALITATATLEQVPDAFAWLAHPDDHAKILVTPNV
jgi:threonine dehydrogenase-like Zn-dependent dehydrogenase